MKHGGFSLIELSIVLVILGLLTGGILTGQSLIRAAEIRAVSKEYNDYASAIHTFRDKYLALPGDMRNATAFWQTAAACPGTNATPSTTAATCDGDGSGFIDHMSGTSQSYERFRFWQHLANAGLITGNYTGVPGAGDNQHVVPGNAPVSKVSDAIWFAQYSVATVSNASIYDGPYGNTLRFGKVKASGNATDPVLKPEEAWNIDTKIDDGRPATGKVLTWKPSVLPNCATDDTMNAAYKLTDTSKACAFIVLAF